MNRGAARQAVFHSATDGRTFEGLLGRAARRFGVEVHAYCLMTNHFHLLLHCPDGGVSDFMQFLGASYTRHLNDRLGRDGPIFRGRFRSLLIDSDRYLAAVGRYIHRNPLDIGPDTDLAQYRWSSFRHYCDPVDCPELAQARHAHTAMRVRPAIGSWWKGRVARHSPADVRVGHQERPSTS